MLCIFLRFNFIANFLIVWLQKMLNDSKLTQRQIKDFETEINQQIETLNETTRDEIEKLRVQMKVCPYQLPVSRRNLPYTYFLINIFHEYVQNT